MLDSPSLFRLVPTRDENSDPNAMVTNRRSCRGAALRRKDRKTRPGSYCDQKDDGKQLKEKKAIKNSEIDDSGNLN
jgi:hypothetical protein